MSPQSKTNCNHSTNSCSATSIFSISPCTNVTALAAVSTTQAATLSTVFSTQVTTTTTALRTVVTTTCTTSLICLQRSSKMPSARAPPVSAAASSRSTSFCGTCSLRLSPPNAVGTGGGDPPSGSVSLGPCWMKLLRSGPP